MADSYHQAPAHSAWRGGRVRLLIIEMYFETKNHPAYENPQEVKVAKNQFLTIIPLVSHSFHPFLYGLLMNSLLIRGRHCVNRLVNIKTRHSMHVEKIAPLMRTMASNILQHTQSILFPAYIIGSKHHEANSIRITI